MKSFWMGLCAVALAVSMWGCSALGLVKRPEVQAVRPKIAGIDLQGVNLVFDVDVSNPYPVALRSPMFRYAIDIQGSEFLKSETNTGIDLPASQVGTVSLPVRLTYANLWNTYKSLGEASEADYTLRGVVALSALGQSYELPLSHSGKFPVLRPPKFSVVNVKFSDVSLRSAKVTVDLDVQNPNAFGADLRELGYALRFGETRVGGLAAATSGEIGAGQTGRVTLTGEIAAANALIQLVRGAKLGKAELAPSGVIKTPYGAVNLGK